MELGAKYMLSSLLITVAMMFYSVVTKMNSYSILIYILNNNKIMILLLLNLIIILKYIVIRYMLIRFFFNKLRDSEVESIYNNIKITFYESLFALTMFSKDINNFGNGGGGSIASSLSFFSFIYFYFFGIIFFKIFHWIIDLRIDFLSQINNYQLLYSYFYHMKFLLLFSVLFFFDFFISFTVFESAIQEGPSIVIIFGFEFLILFINLLYTFLKYVLTVFEVRIMNGNWHYRTIIELYSKVVVDAGVFVAYVSFAGIIFAYYGIPLHLLRELYVSAKNLYDKVHHVYRYRVVMAHLNERFQNATPEQINATDKICIICREEMEAGTYATSPKVLDCGHIFHCHCIQSWLNTRLTCPTCRADIQTEQPAAPNVFQQQQQAQQPLQQQQDAQGGRDPRQLQRDGMIDAMIAAGLLFDGNERDTTHLLDEDNNDFDDDDDDETERADLSGAAEQERGAISASSSSSGASTSAAPAPKSTSVSAALGSSSATAAIKSDKVADMFKSASISTTLGSLPTLSNVELGSHLNEEIALLQLQLKIFQAQAEAAKATHEAALATLRMRKELKQKPVDNDSMTI